MVSTQNSFLPPARLPKILGTSALGKTGPFQHVLSSATVAQNPPPFDPNRLQHLVNRAHAASADVLSDLSYRGTTPKSVANLIAMGASRNDTANTDAGIDETAAFHNDVAYFKVLLQAREKHRAAIREKLEALRSMRIKQRNIYRKRTTAKPTPALVAAALARAVGNTNDGSEQRSIPRDGNWRKLAVDEACASPVSTDVESEVSSDFGDGHVSDDKLISDEKPVIFRA